MNKQQKWTGNATMPCHVRRQAGEVCFRNSFDDRKLMIETIITLRTKVPFGRYETRHFLEAIFTTDSRLLRTGCTFVLHRTHERSIVAQ